MNEWVQIAGWVLVHFLWQGSVLAIVAAAALRFCRRRSSSVRYIVACLALGAMLAAPLLTAFMLASQLSPATFVSGSALRRRRPLNRSRARDTGGLPRCSGGARKDRAREHH